MQVYPLEQMSKLIDDLTTLKSRTVVGPMCFNAGIQAYNYDTVLEFDPCRKAGALNNTS